jgi:hypothetical protein
MELDFLVEPVRALVESHGSGERLMDLDFREPVGTEARRQLLVLAATSAFPGGRNPEAALSGLWLYFNGMDEAHKICQDLAGPDGSFWHGILHRREPDASNAAYWFRRVGTHDIFPALLDCARELSAARPEAGFSAGNRWDPFAFIDFCDAARKKPDSADEQLAKEIQLAEWQLLFEHCARAGS